MRPDIKRVWKELEEAGDEKGLLHLINVFWFTSQTNTLLWVHAKIDELEPEPVEVNNITFEKDSSAVPSPSILSVLRQFAFVGEDEVRIAIDHLLRYLGKRPAETPRLLRVLIDDYGFRPDSYLRRFEVQRTVVDMLWNRAEDGDPLFSRMFLAVAGNYLHIHFENHGMKDDRVLQIRRFELTATEDLAALREAIWQRVFILHEQEDLQDEILALIRHYSMSALEVKNSEVVRADVKHVLPFLESVLEPSSYLHCTAMHDYLDLLEEHDQEVSDDLRDRFRNDTFVLSEILLPDWGVVPELELSLDEYKQYKRDRLEEHTGDYTLNDYARFFEHCLIIREALDEQGNERQIEGEVINALLTLADRDSDLYARVLGHYLELGDPLRLNSYALVQKLVEQQGPDTAFQLLSESKFGTKRRWLFQVPEALPADDIDEEMLAPLFELYASAEPADLPHGFDYLLKYLPLDQRVVAEVVSKVVKKVDHNPDFACVLAMLFNPHTEVAKRLPVLFAEDLNLLKRAYLIAEGTQHHGDYKGQVFDSLLDFDPTFMTEYIEWKYEHAERRWLSSHNDHRDYAFIWSRPDHQEVMDLVVESVYGHDQDSFFSIDPYLKVFFQVRGGSEAEREARERQDAYLLRLIDEHCEDMKFTEYLFRLIAQFSPERRHPFVERFVQRNEDIEAFKGLQLEPNSWTSYGSWVPVLQGRVDYWESLLPLMNTVDLLPHKQYVEREIRALRASIEQEKKKDFIGG